MSRSSAKLFFFSIFILLFFMGLGICVVKNAPEVITLDSLDVLPTTDGAILGFRELAHHPGPRSAERKHLFVRRLDGRWKIANVARRKRVDVRTSLRKTRFLKRWRIARGDRLFLGDISLQITRAGNDILILDSKTEGRKAVWQNGVLHPFEEEYIFEGCRSWWWKIRFLLSWYLRDLLLSGEIRLFTLGGGVNCPDRWRLEDAPHDAARVFWADKGFWIGPGGSPISLRMARGGNEPLVFPELMFPLAGEEGKVDRLVIGRTHYRLVAEPNKLTFKPVFGIDVWFDGKSVSKTFHSNLSQSFKKLPWIGSGTPLFLKLPELGPPMALVLTVAVTICFLIVIGHYRIVKARKKAQPQSLGKKLTVTFSLFFFAPLTVFLWQSQSVDMGYLLFLEWIAWFSATFFLFLSGRLRGSGGWLWIGALFLQCFGLLTLIQLAAGADNTRWLSFAYKHILLMSAFAWVVVVLTLVPVNWMEKFIVRFTIERTGLMKGIRHFLIVSALILLCAQALFGGEGGLWGFQPADMAKLLFVVMAGFVGMHLTEVRRYNSAEYQKRPSKYVWDFLKVLLLISVAILAILVGVRDFSPLLIMVMLALAWIWRVAPHPWSTTPARRANRFAVLVVVIGIGITAFWIHESGKGLPHWIPMKNRFLAWAHPEGYPHSGEQASRAVTLVGQGHWTGAGASWFGLNGMGNTLPQVQNDFIVSFLLYKFGGIAGLVLALVQLIYLWILFAIGRNAYQWGESAGNYRQRQTGSVLSFVIFGLAWVHIGQWGISWGNALGLLPVMGQPMTWISAANSHMVFVGFPALALSLLSAWITETVDS